MPFALSCSSASVSRVYIFESRAHSSSGMMSPVSLLNLHNARLSAVEYRGCVDENFDVSNLSRMSVISACKSSLCIWQMKHCPYPSHSRVQFYGRISAECSYSKSRTLSVCSAPEWWHPPQSVCSLHNFTRTLAVLISTRQIVDYDLGTREGDLRCIRCCPR